MSEPSFPPPPPEKPGWFRQKAAFEPDARPRPSTGTASQDINVTGRAPAAEKKRSTKSTVSRSVLVPQFFLTLKANDAVVHSKFSWLEQLHHEWVHNREGLLTSLGLHALLLVVFALWVLPNSGQGQPTILDVGWTAPMSAQAKEALSQPVKIDTQVGPVRTTAGLSEIKAKLKNTESSDEKKSGEVVVAAKPVPVGGALSARTGTGRSAIWTRLNVDQKSERGIGAGLSWLVRQQEKDGRWKLHEGYPDAGWTTKRTDSGATALALLAFLGDGHSPTDGQHAKAVAKGIAFLKSVQDENGDFHSREFHGEQGRETTYYAHSLATIAMCEAYAMTGDPSLKEPCERAVKFLLKSQHPQNGGWRFQPQVGDSMGDLSVTGIALLALHAARIANIPVPLQDFERASIFLEAVSEQNGARYKYQPTDPLETITAAMTAEGILCRQWLGWPKDHPAQRDAVSFLLSDENRPSWEPHRRNIYEWFFVAQVLHNLGGHDWEKWYSDTSQLILKYQIPGGGEVGGSWHPTKPPGAPSEFAERGGRLYLTAMCLLVLETPIRHAAIYEPAK